MEEFLNPKSMVTPGVAGGVMMFIVNGLSGPFPEVTPRYSALLLSFLIGAFIVLKAKNIGAIERVLYWVVTSLVVFVVGWGSNSVGKATLGASAGAGQVGLSALVPSAYADDATPKAVVKKKARGTAKNVDLPGHAGAPAVEKVAPTSVASPGQGEQVQKLQQQLQDLEAQRKALADANAKLQQEKEVQAQAKAAKSSSFFKEW
jgi:hypothetical protein